MKSAIKQLIILFTATTIFTASNALLVFWRDNLQCAALIVLCSIAIGGAISEITSQIKVIVSSWIFSLILTAYLIIQPLIMIGESTEKINEVVFSTVSQLILLSLIGMIASITISITTSLLLEYKRQKEAKKEVVF